MTVVLWLVLGMLAVAGALALYRIARGPTLLDRVVASDVLIVVVMCGLGAEAAVNGHTTTLPVIFVLAAFGFLGSLSVARFFPKEEDS